MSDLKVRRPKEKADSSANTAFGMTTLATLALGRALRSSGYKLKRGPYNGSDARLSEEAGYVFAHHVLPVRPVVAAIGAPVVEGVADIFAG